MNAEIRLALIFLFVVAIYAAAIRYVLWRFLTPFTQKLIIILTAIETIWGFIHLLTAGDRTFLGWFFHPSSEHASMAMMNSGVLLLVGLTSFIVGFRRGVTHPVRHRVYWWFFAAIFFYLWLDEYYSFHETHELWRTLANVAGIGMVLVAIIKYGLDRELDMLLFLVIGLGIIGFAGIWLDAFSNEAPMDIGSYEFDLFVCNSKIVGVYCQRLGIVEEFLETAGASLILVGFVSYMQKGLSAPQWRSVKRLLAGAATLWGVWVAVTLWLVPSAQAEIMAQDVKVNYLDGRLAMIGSDISTSVAKPGDEFDVTMYFRSNQFLSENYFLSVHLLSHPEVNSVAQADIQLGQWVYPSSAWIPGLAVKNVAHLKLPDDLPAPRSYWVTVRVWEGPFLDPGPGMPIVDPAEGEKVVITEADHQLISEDTVILYSLPVLSDAEVPAPTTAADYNFSDGFTLYGYDLPPTLRVGETAPLKLWWKTNQNVDRDLTYFIHLVDPDTQETYALDQKPFGEALPTADWPEGLNAVDERPVTISADVPPGDYQVFIGTYEIVSGIRSTVTDQDGQHVPNDAINLGTVTVES